MRGAVAAAAVVLVAAGVATAARKPTAGENKAIREAAHAFLTMPNSPASKTNRIASITVSTRDPRYAHVWFDSGSVGPSDLVLHRGSFGWREVGFGSSVNCDAAPKVVMDDLKVGCTPPNGVAWIDDCGRLVSKPPELVLACGDGNFFLGKIVWTGWAKATATGKAVAQANTCTPNCAAGKFKAYGVRLAATKLTACGRARYYARLTVTFLRAPPPGLSKRAVYPLGC